MTPKKNPKAYYLMQVVCWFECLVNIHLEESKSLPDFVTEVPICFNVTHINIYNMPYRNSNKSMQKNNL